MSDLFGYGGPPMFLVASLVSMYFSASVAIKISFKWLYNVFGFTYPLTATIVT